MCTVADLLVHYAACLAHLLLSPQVLAPCAEAINLNNLIMDLYLQELVPGITEPGDDNNYGSAAMQDVLCLQALSKRIHYGKFVAEAKFRADPEQYQRLIQNKDQDAIMHTLTSIDVEKKVCCILLGVSYTLASNVAAVPAEIFLAKSVEAGFKPASCTLNVSFKNKPVNHLSCVTSALCLL